MILNSQCCIEDGALQYLTRNLQCLHHVCCLARPSSSLSSSLHEGFMLEFRSLLFFYYTEGALYCSVISPVKHISASFRHFSLCWLPKVCVCVGGEHRQQNIGFFFFFSFWFELAVYWKKCT